MHIRRYGKARVLDRFFIYYLELGLKRNKARRMAAIQFSGCFDLILVDFFV